MDQGPSVMSLFSGCGGMDLGFEKAGFKIVWANDIDHWACETYRQNFKTPICEGDIENIDFNNLKDIDVVIGGFPCQDFSVLSKRKGINAKRGNLYKNFIRAVSNVKPKIFIAENVKGILSANKGNAIKIIIKDFSDLGYNVHHKLYKFVEYGVPQTRERVLIIGIRKDLNFIYIPPEPTHKGENYITVKEAFEGVEKVKHNQDYPEPAERTKMIISLIPEGKNYKEIPKNSPYYVKGLMSGIYKRVHRDKPSPTIIANGGGGTWGYHYSENRPLTNRERARLQTFPDDFIFKGTTALVRKQIGNAVPPKGIYPIAKQIYKFFEREKCL